MTLIENYTGKKYWFPRGFSFPKGEATYTENLVYDEKNDWYDPIYQVHGLPAPKANTLYMVSPFVIMAAPERNDLVSMFDTRNLLKGKNGLEHDLA